MADERKKRVKEIKKELEDIEAKEKELMEATNALQKEERELNAKEFEVFGLFGNANYQQAYIDRCKCMVTIQTDTIDWSKKSPEDRLHYDVRPLLGSNKYEVEQGNVRKMILEEGWTKADDDTKFLPKMVRFKEVKEQSKGKLIGITARGKMILFECKITPDNEGYTYYILQNGYYYDLRSTNRKGGYTNYEGRIKLIGHFDNYQDIVEFLI